MFSWKNRPKTPSAQSDVAIRVVGPRALWVYGAPTRLNATSHRRTRLKLKTNNH